MKGASEKEEFCRDFGRLGKNFCYRKSTKCEEKLRLFQLFWEMIRKENC